MNPKTKRLFLLVPVIAALAAVFFFLRSNGIMSNYTAEGMRDWIAQFSPWSEAVFFAMQLASVIIAPIPSNVTAVAGGLLFGFPHGFLLTIAAVVLGSCTTFSLARWLGQEKIQHIVSQKLSDRYLNVIQRKRDVFLLMAFLFPFFPDDILCILAGLTDIPLKRFVVIVLVARPWGLLVASALGGSALQMPTWAIPLCAVGLMGLFYLGMKYGDVAEAELMHRFGHREPSENKE